VARFEDACVADYMTWPVVSVAPGTLLREIDRQFARHDFNAFPVVEGNLLAGIVSKFDMLKLFLCCEPAELPNCDPLDGLTASAIMSRNVVTFRPSTPMVRVLRTVVDFRLKSFPVVDGQRLVGMVARTDILRALRETVTARRL